MEVSGILKTTLIDFPGVLSCAIFTQGCNYNCYYCHNRELIEEKKGSIDTEYVLDFLYSRKNFLDGVVVTGGEPSLQKDIIPFMLEIRNMGYSIKLDSNGSSPDFIYKCLNQNICDYYAIDYKATPKIYKKICGINAEESDVSKTIRFLHENKTDFEVRTTVIPQLSLNDLRNIKAGLPPGTKYILNRYVPNGEKFLDGIQNSEKKIYTKEEIEKFSEII